jgi:hypothetical protein
LDFLCSQTEVDLPQQQPQQQQHPSTSVAATATAASAGSASASAMMSANLMANDFTLSPEMTDCDSADLVPML